MRVVQLLPELNEGGVERGVVELSRELVKRGIESWIVSAGGRLVPEIEADGGRHVTFDVAAKNPLTAWSRVRGLRRILAQMNPDIIHARSRVPAWLGFLANRSLKRPFVTTVHGFNSVNAYSKVMTYGDRVICVSNAVKEYVKKNYGTPDDKMVVIPRGVDLDHFDPKKVDRKFIQVFSERYGLKGKFVVTSVGRITQLKDYETFISALVMIKRDIPEAVALIVGGVHEDRKEYFAKLQQMVKNIQSESYIHFTGSQSNVAEIYAMSNIVVSSSRKPESFGRSAAEALAMNVPVVATGHGGILDIVIDGKTGFLFEPGDLEGLALAIKQCRETELQNLRNFIASSFTLDQMVEQTLSVYHRIRSSSRLTL